MGTTILLSIISFLVLVGIVLSIILIKRNRESDSGILSNKLERYETKLDSYEKNLKDEFERNRKETAESNTASRKENTEVLMNFQNSVGENMNRLSDSIANRLESVLKMLDDKLREEQKTIQDNLHNIQSSNEKKLEEMRVTVDEKLQSTLEKRLTGSFEIVSKQLEAVQNGLGTMTELAKDVGGLKRVLTNVKSAGGMGEIQLEVLLTQILSPEQFVKNAHPNPSDTKKVVEFAVKIPSKTTNEEFVLLPIDSKYPSAVWDKLSLAYEKADKDEIEVQKKALVLDIKKMAKDIKEKYIEVPYTTDFGLMFLPFEGLFAEVMRIPGLFQEIQDTYRVTIAGPTTLGAFLNSLQMGFRTLAIQKETSKVWELLGSVKTEFGKFGDVLSATKRKLELATSEIEKAETRSRVIEKKLTKVDVLLEGKSGDQGILDEVMEE